MKIKRLHNGTDRYAFDFGLCSTSKGYAQLDTEQDAVYFGTWINPFKLEIVNYCEGDITITKCADQSELSFELKRINEWNIVNGFKPVRIDPGFNAELKEKFLSLGLENWLH